MCLAIYCEAGASCAESDLRTAFEANPDGAGFMFINSGGSLVIEKFLTFDPFIKALTRAWAENPESPFGVHFRYATHGTRGLENVHPFTVDKHTGMLHNGMLPVVMGKGSKRSDTAVFAEDYLAALPSTWFDDPFLFDMVEQYCAGSKLVVLTVHPDAKYSGYIINEHGGHWDEKGTVWYSNGSYQRGKSFCAIPSKKNAESWWADAPLDEFYGNTCVMCAEQDVMDGVCFACESCQKCLLEVDRCECGMEGYSVHRMTDMDIAGL